MKVLAAVVYLSHEQTDRQIQLKLLRIHIPGLYIISLCHYAVSNIKLDPCVTLNLAICHLRKIIG